MCAALFDGLSLSVVHERPKLATLYRDKEYWFEIIGVNLLTPKGKTLGSQRALAEAYMESYRLDTLSKYSVDDLALLKQSCLTPQFQRYGNDIISTLRPKLNH